MHHLEQHPSRTTLELIKVPGARRKGGTEGEWNSSPNPDNRINFPGLFLGEDWQSLVSNTFFTFLSCRRGRGVEKGKKMLSRGKCLHQDVKRPNGWYLPSSWQVAEVLGVTDRHPNQHHSWHRVKPSYHSRVWEESRATTLPHSKSHTVPTRFCWSYRRTRLHGSSRPQRETNLSFPATSDVKWVWGCLQ